MAAGIIGDLESNAVALATVYGSSTGITNAQAGTTVDLVDTVGNYANAVMVVGTISGTGTPTLNVKMQESTDGTTWVDAVDASGNTLTFAAVSASSNVQVVGWQPLRRYCRSTATTVSGTSPIFPTSITVIAQRRATPANSGGFSQTAAAS